MSRMWVAGEVMTSLMCSRVLRSCNTNKLHSISRNMAMIASQHRGSSYRCFSSTSSSSIDSQSLAEAFEIIARSRYAERNFAPNSVPPSIVKKILELAILAPSSFNLQPYKMLVVQNENARLNLSTAMLGGNSHIVSTAPTSVVFLADKGELLQITSICWSKILIRMSIIIFRTTQSHRWPHRPRNQAWNQSQIRVFFAVKDYVVGRSWLAGFQDKETWHSSSIAINT